VRGNVIEEIANKMSPWKYIKKVPAIRKKLPNVQWEGDAGDSDEGLEALKNIFSKTLNNFNKNYPMYSEKQHKRISME
jgi:hypothetical protein